MLQLPYDGLTDVKLRCSQAGSLRLASLLCRGICWISGGALIAYLEFGRQGISVEMAGRFPVCPEKHQNSSECAKWFVPDANGSQLDR
jgi:hypothetical protein